MLIAFLLFEFINLTVMDLKIFAFVAFLCCQNYVNAQYQNKFISQPGGSLTIQYPVANESPRYKVYAPADTFIQATCSLTSTCGTHIFAISRNGETDLSDQVTYCGNGKIVAKSVANEIYVALNANTASFSCQFIAIKPDNTNCDCGWSVTSKIVGGTQTRINGFVSHAALIDKPTTVSFCGAILSESF